MTPTPPPSSENTTPKNKTQTETPLEVARSDKTLSQKMQTARNTKKYRIGFMVVLLILVVILFLTGVIKKGFAIGIGIILLAAIGIETFNYDLDLGKLWETGSIQESRVTHTQDGLVLMGGCAIPKRGSSEDLNCANFATQAEAQAKYDQCAAQISRDNQGVDASRVRSLDIYGLDGNKNGVVCEHLPKTAR